MWEVTSRSGDRKLLERRRGINTIAWNCPDGGASRPLNAPSSTNGITSFGIMLLLAGDTRRHRLQGPPAHARGARVGSGAWFSWRDHRVDKVLKKAMRQPGRLCVRGSQIVRRFPEKPVTLRCVIEGYIARQK